MDEAVLAKVHRAFTDAGVEYALVGRTAARVWGAPVEPAQGEIEVLARIAPGEADDLLAAARAQGFDADPGLAELAVESGEHLTLFPGGEAFVDVKPARGASDLAALRARVDVVRDEAEVTVATVEETIARLLDAGDEESLVAARHLVREHRSMLDLGYLGQRSEELRVGALLREVLEALAPAA
jgi:hypothetical protein